MTKHANTARRELSVLVSENEGNQNPVIPAATDTATAQATDTATAPAGAAQDQPADTSGATEASDKLAAALARIAADKANKGRGGKLVKIELPKLTQDQMLKATIHGVKNNPKRGEAAKRYGLLTEGLTVAEYCVACVDLEGGKDKATRYLDDIRWDLQRGFYTIKLADGTQVPAAG